MEEKISNLQEELDEIPIVKEFKDSQVEVNDLLQMVATTISNKVTDEIIASTGGNLLSGETAQGLKIKIVPIINLTSFMRSLPHR